MIFIAGMTLAVFFEVLLLAKKEKSAADRVLAAWMFLITAHLFLFYLTYTGELFNYPFLLGAGFPFPLLHGVMLFLYVAFETGQLPGRPGLLVLHFIPAVLMYAYLIPFFLLPGEEKILVFRNRGAGHETFNSVRQASVLLSGVVYVAWSSLLLRRHRLRVLDRFSYRDRIDLRWLQILIAGMGAIWLLVFVGDDVILFSGVTVFVFLIGFFGIRQRRVFPVGEPPTPGGQSSPPQPPGREKYARSGLSREQGDTIYRELMRLMGEEAIYRKSDLSADDLASRLNIHPNHVSQVINEKEGRNFYDFVNHYRLEEFKRVVADPKNRNLTLLALAFDCGFNSKSSFNRHFRKVTGQTPSEFAASIRRV